MRSSNLALGCALALAVPCVVLAVPAARAFCTVPTPNELLTVIPADGATDVPTDAHIWVLAGFGVHAEFSVEGGVGAVPIVAHGPWAEVALTGTKPGDTVTWSVALAPEGAPAAVFGPYTFRVGAATAGAVTTPVLDHVEIVPKAPLTGPCDGLLQVQDCFDTGQDTLLRVHVEPQPGAALYRACRESPGSTGCGLPFAVPSTCPPAIYTWSHTLGIDPPTCVRVEAVSIAGAVSETLVACTDDSSVVVGAADADGTDGGDAGVAETEGSSGCAASAPPPGLPPLALPLLLLLWTRRLSALPRARHTTRRHGSRAEPVERAYFLALPQPSPAGLRLRVPRPREVRDAGRCGALRPVMELTQGGSRP